MPRVISWGIGGRLKVERMVIINQGVIKVEFDDGTSVDIVAMEDETLEIQAYDAKGTYLSSEPVDVGWAGHA